MNTLYYLIGDGSNLMKKEDAVLFYLDAAGRWQQHPALLDKLMDGDAEAITLAQAQVKAAQLVPGLVL